MKKYLLLGCLLFLSFSLGYSQEPFPNILLIESVKASPPATLQDIAWIQGHWQGEAFGSIVEEVWTPPLGGSMMCAFKLVSIMRFGFMNW